MVSFNTACSSHDSADIEVELPTYLNDDNVHLELPRENSLPKFAQLRGTGKNIYSLVQWKNGEEIADYVLFEDSFKKCRVPWITFDGMTNEEKTIYIEHIKAVGNKKLKYKCPQTRAIYKTVSQLLYEGSCCGSGCRHCPYELANCSDQIKKALKWNGSHYV